MAYLPIKNSENVWYFAYGSNMSTAKFTGSRRITPLSAARVRLPGWVLAMEIPGTPYSEPSFSSIRPKGCASNLGQVEVIGVAYLITQMQYHEVIASEGSGIAYNDISLRAIPVYAEDEAKTGHSIQVRTLGTAMSRRPCGLPSTRYMDIVKTGAAEAKLPMDYQQYLSNIPPYQKPKAGRAALGAAIFLCFWSSIMSLMEMITKSSVQEDGNVSNLVVWLVRTTVYVMWFSHDRLFAPVFGRGDGLREDPGRPQESGMKV